METPNNPQELRTGEAHLKHLDRIKARNKRITLLSVSICLCLTLIACVVAGVIIATQEPEDDGLILPNVIVGGINIGGMNLDDATSALRLSIQDTLSRKSMVVELPGSSLALAPSDTKIELDLEKLIEKAYAYGRTGSNLEKKIIRAKAEKTAYHIPLLPYLDLDLDYIRGTIDAFCDGYSIQITQPSVTLSGVRPEYVYPEKEEEPEEGEEDQEEEKPTQPVEPPKPVVHQVMTITMGTPQFLLDSQDLYDTVLDGYSLLELEIQYQAPDRIEPDPLDLQAIFEEYCVSPVDAMLDANSFTVTREIVGYGFNIQAVQALIDEAGYGQQIQVTLDFLMPDITEEAYDNLFLDVLAEFVSNPGDGSNSNRDRNLLLACQAINGYVIKVGETFDFNQLLGPRTTDKGYLIAPNYAGSTTNSIGGGISQVASALHYCALVSGLQINERHPHRYAVNYSPLGTDAAITYGSENLVFLNNTSDPIRIEATAEGSQVTIKLLGTEDRDYRLEVESDILETNEPGTVYQAMAKDNVLGYVDGQVLTPACTGYKVRVNLCRYDLETGELLLRLPAYEFTYDKRDQVVVRIESDEPPATEPPVTEPPATIPGPTDPSGTVPGPTESSGTVPAPSEPTGSQPETET